MVKFVVPLWDSDFFFNSWVSPFKLLSKETGFSFDQPGTINASLYSTDHSSEFFSSRACQSNESESRPPASHQFYRHLQKHTVNICKCFYLSHLGVFLRVLVDLETWGNPSAAVLCPGGQRTAMICPVCTSLPEAGSFARTVLFYGGRRSMLYVRSSSLSSRPAYSLLWHAAIQLDICIV